MFCHNSFVKLFIMHIFINIPHVTGPQLHICKRVSRKSLHTATVGTGPSCIIPLWSRSSAPCGSLPVPTFRIVLFCRYRRSALSCRGSHSNLSRGEQKSPAIATLGPFGRYAVWSGSDGYSSRAQISRPQKIRCGWSIRKKNQLKLLQ